MTAFPHLMPGQPVPDLALPLVGGGSWSLSAQSPRNFTLIVVYRGLHCPICKTYLRELQAALARFEALGTGVIAVSSDDRERAERSRADWGLDRLPLAHGMTLTAGRSFGLYVSAGRTSSKPGLQEPAYFVEPGHFLIRPDRTLYFASVQTMPFTRPPVAEILDGLEWIVAHDYPARGEVVDLPA